MDTGLIMMMDEVNDTFNCRNCVGVILQIVIGNEIHSIRI